MSQLPVVKDLTEHPLAPTIAPMMPRPSSGQVWTTLPSASHADKVRVANLAQGQGRPAEDVKDEPFEVMDLLLKGVTITDPESGEVADCIMALLVPPTGQAIQTVSWGVISSLETLISVFGRPPWNPPLTCKLEQFRTRRKFISYRLTVLDNHLPG